MEQLEKFREETRRWLEENCPRSMRKPVWGDDEVVWGGRRAVYKDPDSRVWLERTAERGWTAPTWPREYGGGGLSKEEARILQAEMRQLVETLAGDVPEALARLDVVKTDTTEGAKYFLANGNWVMFRPSGTEPVARCYIDADSPGAMAEIESAAREFLAQFA